MDVFTFDHLDRCQVAYWALYTPVTNASDIRQRIVAAATQDGPDGDKERDQVNFAFLDASLITSALHLQTAIYQAILSELHGSLRTKTVHSEILWALNPSNNITEAIRRYGISVTTKTLLVVHIADKTESEAAIHAKLARVVHGARVPASALSASTDWNKIKKYYKLDEEAALAAVKGDPVKQQALIDNIVVSSVAMKSVMA